MNFSRTKNILLYKKLLDNKIASKGVNTKNSVF